MERPTLTPEQARQQLADVESRVLGCPRDRRLHAIGTAVFGVSIALGLVTQNVLSGTARLALSCVLLAVMVGEGIGVERAARTVPRRARLWSRVGIGASFAVGLGFVMPWLNLEDQSSPNTWPMVAAAACLVALPSLAAAVVISRDRR
ncbi:UNVERIFIED_ORG: hypothetical protein E4P37_07435 [Bacillus sp. AZ43]